MKQPFVGSSNIAWFKLAEFVARGEKERTLSMYRLLTHSFEDDAVVKQLEGDLLLTFKDETGYNSYEMAANLYYAQGRFEQAIFLYEQLVEALPHIERYYDRLNDLYLHGNNYERMVLFGCRHVQQIYDISLNAKAAHLLHSLYKQVHQQPITASVWVVFIHTSTACVLDKTTIQSWVQELAHLFATRNQSHELNLFLHHIKEMDMQVHAATLGVLNNLVQAY